MLLLAGNGLFVENVLVIGNRGQGIAVILLLVILYLYIWLILERSGKPDLYSVAGAVLFAFFSATGNLSLFDMYGWGGYLSSFFSWFLLFYLCLQCCFQIFPRLMLFDGEAREQRTEGGKRKRKILFCGAIFFGMTVLVDSLFLFAFFPGVMEYDSFIQMCQVYGAPYSNHHPWLHTMLIKAIYGVGQVLGSNNRAYALYSLFSICILASSFACVAAYLYGKGLKRRYLVLLGAVYLLSPINQMYSITMWKDIPFAVSVLWFSFLLCVMKDRMAEGRRNRFCWGLFILLGFCVCFFRSNGLYVFIGMIPFVIGAFWRQKRAAVLAIALVLVMGAFYKGPIFSCFQVEEPDVIESLSIPAQQIAAVIAYEGEISEEQQNLLSKVVDLSKVPEAYLGSPSCSDAVKDLVREKDEQEYITEHAGEFLRCWGGLFWNNKRIYIRAFADETRGYWYHKVYFPFIWATYIQENGMGIYRASQFPEAVVSRMRDFLGAYKEHFDRYLSTGLYIYIYFICLLTALRQENRYLISYLPVLGIWATLLIATPVFADLRYAYAIYVSVPFFVCLTCSAETGCRRDKGRLIWKKANKSLGKMKKGLDRSHMLQYNDNDS